MRSSDHPELPGFDLPSHSSPNSPKYKRQRPLAQAAARTRSNLVVSSRTENIFLAILPDSAAGFRIRRIAFSSRVEHGLSGRVFDAPRLHLSLHSLGPSVGELSNYVSRCGEFFAPLAATTAPFEIVVDRALSFQTRQEKLPFVLRSAARNDALMNFHFSLAAPFARPKGTLTPHVTVLYDSKKIDEHPIEPVSWIASELVLVRSLVGQGVHEHLARWPFLG